MQCRICKNSNNNTIYSVKEMMYGSKDEFTYFQCSQCECLQIANVPKDISKYYPANYYSFSAIPKSQLLGSLMNNIKKLKDTYTVKNIGLIGRFLDFMKPNVNLRSLSHINLTKESKILDVGCGNGTLLYALREIGFSNTEGIDPYIKKSIVYDNGLEIKKINIHNIDGQWDLVMFHHSFEHILDQIETLSSASSLMKKGGYCLIRVPTVSSYAWEHYRENWVQLDAPRHFYLHSLKSMEYLAKKTNFVIEKVIFDSSDFQFVGSEQYSKGIPLLSNNLINSSLAKPIYSKRELKFFKKQSIVLNKLNRGDQASFYLRKK